MKLLTVDLAAMVSVGLLFAAAPMPAVAQQVSDELSDELAKSHPDCLMPVVIQMAKVLTAEELQQSAKDGYGKARRSAVTQALKMHADATQADVRKYLIACEAAGSVRRVTYLWMANAILCEAQPQVLRQLMLIPEVGYLGLSNAPMYRGSPDDSDGHLSQWPLAEDFESGVLAPKWTVGTTGAGSVTVTSMDEPIGSFHCEFDSAVDGVDSTASITMTLDLEGQSDIGLRYWLKQFHDEADALDGVFLSADGVAWTKAAEFGPSSMKYALHTIELDPILAAAGISSDHVVMLRFQWHDNFGIPTDGLALDNIEVGPGLGAPVLPAPEPNVSLLQAPELWNIGFDGTGQLVGLIDTGVWVAHPDLAQRIWNNPAEVENGIDDDGNGLVDDLAGWDFTTNSADVASGNPHGTCAAGLVCGDGSGGIKLTGMAPGAKLVCLEVATEGQYWAAQQYCLAAGVDCISSSVSFKWFSSPKPAYFLHRQMCNVELVAGIIHVNSAGNEGQMLSIAPIPFNIATPGNCPAPFPHPALSDGGQSSVIAVGGIGMEGQAYAPTSLGPSAWEDIKLYDPSYSLVQDSALWDYPFGGFGGAGAGLIKPDVVAYASNVVTTNIGKGYTEFSGTSAAAPQVAGAVALLRCAQPEAEPRHVDAALELTAQDLGAPGKDNVFGSGRIRAFEAARRLVVLGRAGDRTASLGGSLIMEVFAPPNSIASWFVSVDIAANASELNLLLPYFAVATVQIGASGRVVVDVSVPSLPALSGVQVWSQFTTKSSASKWGPKRLWSVPEDVLIQ